MTLPAGWVVIPVAGQDINALLGLLGQAQPQVAELIRQYLAISGASVSTVAADPRGALTGLPPSAIVLLQPTLGFSLDLAGGVVATATIAATTAAARFMRRPRSPGRGRGTLRSG